MIATTLLRLAAILLPLCLFATPGDGADGDDAYHEPVYHEPAYHEPIYHEPADAGLRRTATSLPSPRLHRVASPVTAAPPDALVRELDAARDSMLARTIHDDEQSWLLRHVPVGTLIGTGLGIGFGASR